VGLVAAPNVNHKRDTLSCTLTSFNALRGRDVNLLMGMPCVSESAWPRGSQHQAEE
jgi:hypothetical protein